MSFTCSWYHVLFFLGEDNSEQLTFGHLKLYYKIGSRSSKRQLETLIDIFEIFSRRLPKYICLSIGLLFLFASVFSATVRCSEVATETDAS